jgi:hypothetical protein
MRRCCRLGSFPKRALPQSFYVGRFPLSASGMIWLLGVRNAMRPRRFEGCRVPKLNLFGTASIVWAGSEMTAARCAELGRTAGRATKLKPKADCAAWEPSGSKVRPRPGLGLLQKAKAVPADTVLKINPLRRKLEHQIAWIVACLLGAVVGVLYGFSHSQLGSGGAGQGVHFLLWFQHLEFIGTGRHSVPSSLD